MEFSPKYTVSIKGKDFQLDQSQIEFDSPNYFTICFLGDFREAQTRHVELSRDPELFQLIVSYLSGYEIFPLTDKNTPATMSSISALINLRADAKFYQLEGLAAECDSLIDHLGVKNVKENRFLVLGDVSYSNMDELDSMDNYVDDPIYRIPTSASWRTYVTQEKFSQEPFNQLTTPGLSHGIEGMRQASAVGRFILKSIKNYNPLDWKLVGWWTQESYRGEYQASELVVVVEDLKRACVDSSI
ncbi:unnamed protein product [Rhizoctonia solani]|uniref:BTB domain-containing protein n=1 Tax=Rhizoctonia solani TaxID=456999 RepID=A0A8H2WAU0_9AGAM|nr:unnamed protein product [Rhizoctonia solani]